GIALRSGRFFTEQDSKDSLPVAIVDETLVEQYYPGQDPIGKRIAAYFESKNNQPNWRTIVGVVGNVKQYGLEGKRKKVQYYFPLAQFPSPFMYLAVRSSSTDAGLVPGATAAIQHVDKDQPISRVMSMDDVVADSVAEQRFVVFLLSIFAAVALALA